MSTCINYFQVQATSIVSLHFISLIPIANSKFFLELVCLLFASLLYMTGESAHIALEERLAPGLLLSSECIPYLSIK